MVEGRGCCGWGRGIVGQKMFKHNKLSYVFSLQILPCSVLHSIGKITLLGYKNLAQQATDISPSKDDLRKFTQVTSLLCTRQAGPVG